MPLKCSPQPSAASSDAAAQALPRAARYESALRDPLPVGLTIARDLSRGPRYEQRLEQSIARSMRELRAYRKDLREHGRPVSWR